MDDPKLDQLMKGMCFDRQGQPITGTQYFELRMRGFEYSRVAYTKVSASVHVSTLWFGTNHRHGYPGNKPPIIFETVVLRESDGDDDECWRYSTEAEALAGHKRVVAEVSAELEGKLRRLF